MPAPSNQWEPAPDRWVDSSFLGSKYVEQMNLKTWARRHVECGKHTGETTTWAEGLAPDRFLAPVPPTPVASLNELYARLRRAGFEAAWDVVREYFKELEEKK